VPRIVGAGPVEIVVGYTPPAIGQPVDVSAPTPQRFQPAHMCFDQCFRVGGIGARKLGPMALRIVDAIMRFRQPRYGVVRSPALRSSDRDDRAKRQHLMAEANQAYEQGDEWRLEKVLTAYEHSPEAVQGEGPGAELIRVIRRVSQARGRLAEIEAELQGLLRSDLHQLKSRVDEAEKSGHDVLQDMIAKVDEQIALAKQRLKESAPLSR